MAKLTPIPKKKRSSAPRAILAIDFDGTLADPTTMEPLPNAVETLELFTRRGIRVIIHSARATTDSGMQMIRNWCHKQNFRPHDITAKKPTADLYIDNRAVYHTDWVSSVHQVMERLNIDLT